MIHRTIKNRRHNKKPISEKKISANSIVHDKQKIDFHGIRNYRQVTINY